MFNVLILSAESLSKIAVLEGINKPENYEQNIEALAELRRRSSSHTCVAHSSDPRRMELKGAGLLLPMRLVLTQLNKMPSFTPR